MRYLLPVIVLCLGIVLFPAVGQAAAPALVIKDGVVMVERDGKLAAVPEDAAALLSVTHSDLRYVTFGEESGKIIGLPAGLYLFDQQGTLVASVASEAAEVCAEVQLSPKGTVLAMDAGTWFTRSWFFFSFPDMKPLGRTSYYDAYEKPTLLWAGEADVLFTTINEKTERVCPEDPCGEASVTRYDIAKGTAVTLFAGTPQCDYVLVSLEAGILKAEKFCRPDSKNWSSYREDESGEPVTMKLP